MNGLVKVTNVLIVIGEGEVSASVIYELLGGKSRKEMTKAQLVSMLVAEAQAQGAEVVVMTEEALNES